MLQGTLDINDFQLHHRRDISITEDRDVFTISESKGSPNVKYFHDNTFDPDKIIGYAEPMFCSSNVDKKG